MQKKNFRDPIIYKKVFLSHTKKLLRNKVAMMIPTNDSPKLTNSTKRHKNNTASTTDIQYRLIESTVLLLPEHSIIFPFDNLNIAVFGHCVNITLGAVHFQ